MNEIKNEIKTLNQLFESYFSSEEVNQFKIKFWRCSLLTIRPDFDIKKRLKYKFNYVITFSLPDNLKDKKLTEREITEEFKEKVLKTKKFIDLLKEAFYKTTNYLNERNNEIKYIDVEIIDNKTAYYNYYVGKYCIEIEFYLYFNLAEYWADSIVSAETSKSLFFKNYKIRFQFEVNNLLKYHTPSFEEKSVEAIIFGIRNIPRLNKFISSLTKLEVDSSYPDFEIKIDPSDKTIKLFVVRGAVKWLTKLGLPAWLSKYIITGITIYGLIKILNKLEDEEAKKETEKIDKYIKTIKDLVD